MYSLSLRAQPEDSNELFQKLLEDLKELAEYKESLENSFKEIVVSNSNEEKEDPPQDFDIRKLIREECCVEVSEEQKQKMEDTILYALNSKLFLINSNSQHLDKKDQEVKNVVEQPAERGTPVEKSLQNSRVIHKKPEHSLNMGYEYLSITPETESDEVTKSNAKNLLPIPSECEVTSEDEIEQHPHCFNVESDFVESLLNHDTFIDSSSKFDFSCELAHVNPEITESDFDFEEEIYLSESLLYVNSSSQTPEEHNVEEERIKREHADYINRMEMLFTINPRPHPTMNANTNVESISSLPIPIQDNDSQREEIDIVTNTDDVLPPSVENDDSDGEVNDVEELCVDNSILNTEHEYSESEKSDQDDPSVPLPPSEPPDEELDFKDEILVVRNTIVEFECIDAKDEFDVSNVENDDYFPFMFVIRIFLPDLISFKVFSFRSAKSEDTIFDP
nr:hypothetical protein [Tanacetum cinerariifolium]